ncbi:Rv3654c family TadE-like protein [Streptomyces roseolus]|uniref:Rv3654c family TadE-like protein n=1 Tax=Streptomyces roseolus TaxID=67358 RepID=UPI0036FCD7DE
MVFGAVLALGQAVAARHRAGGAADLAALAAADRALWGEPVACGAARRVATAQGVELLHCRLTGAEAEVTTRTSVGPWTPTARSRAGPATPGPPPPAPQAPGLPAPGPPAPDPQAPGPPASGPPASGFAPG